MENIFSSPYFNILIFLILAYWFYHFLKQTTRTKDNPYDILDNPMASEEEKNIVKNTLQSYIDEAKDYTEKYKLELAFLNMKYMKKASFKGWINWSISKTSFTFYYIFQILLLFWLFTLILQNDIFSITLAYLFLDFILYREYNMLESTKWNKKYLSELENIKNKYNIE